MGRKKTTIASNIVELYLQGYSCKDICLACNLSAVTVRNHLQAAGFNTRHYRKVSDNNREKVVLLIKAGYSYSHIEKLLQLSTHLIREVVELSNLIGFAPKFHHPIEFDIQEYEVSTKVVQNLRTVYLTGKYGLVKCADKVQASNKEFLWFIYHLTAEEMKIHSNKMKKNIKKMVANNFPVTAIAKTMDISPSIVKKYLV